MQGGHSRSGPKAKRTARIITKLPHSPADFSPAMRAKYREIGQLLIASGTLTEGSLDVLAQYVRVLEMCSRIEEELRHAPLSNADGSKNPLISEWRLMVDQARKYQGDLKLTPATTEPEGQSEADQAEATFAKYAR